MELITRAHGEHAFGYTPMAEMNGVHAEMLMDFGVLRMRKGDRVVESQPLEKAYLLVYGKVRFTWEGKVHEQERENCFDVPPTALHVCKDVQVTLECLSEECEIDILRTDNDKVFPSKLYLPEDTPDEFRGAGTMHETSTRIVRTIFDDRNAPYANLVLGEVIGFPGKWSSYPPHHHPQPEIYYYKTNPAGGFAYAEVGEDVLKVHNNDTVDPSPVHTARVRAMVSVGHPSPGRRPVRDAHLPQGASVGAGARYSVLGGRQACVKVAIRPNGYA